MKRRLFLISTGTVVTACFWLFNKATNNTDLANPGLQVTEDLATLKSVVDTLIPKTDTLGALELGLDQKLVGIVQSNPNEFDLVSGLLASLASLSLSQHQRTFDELDIDQREGLLNQLLARDFADAKARQAMQKLRTTLLSWYYQSREGAAGINYVLPGHYPSHPGSSLTRSGSLSRSGSLPLSGSLSRSGRSVSTGSTPA